MAVALVAVAGWADPPAAPAPTLYDNPSSLVTSSRLVALAGAAVGLAENSESIPFNYAAVAQRAVNRTRGFDFDLTAAIQLLPFDGLRNIDNEPSSPQIKEPVESQFGGYVQFKRFGLGAYARLSRRNICVTSCDNALTATTAQGAIVFGFNLLQDQLVFGVGLHISSGATFRPHTTPPTPLNYTGFALGGGSLFRPHFFPMRFGMSFITAASGTLNAGDVANPMIVGRVHGRSAGSSHPPTRLSEQAHGSAKAPGASTACRRRHCASSRKTSTPRRCRTTSSPMTHGLRDAFS